MAEVTLSRTTVDVDSGQVKHYSWWPKIGDSFDFSGERFSVTSNDPMFAVSTLANDKGEKRTATWELLLVMKNRSAMDGDSPFMDYIWPAPQDTGETK